MGLVKGFERIGLRVWRGGIVGSIGVLRVAYRKSCAGSWLTAQLGADQMRLGVSFVGYVAIWCRGS